ncbi:hypothetical protein [Nostoc sp.]|uniref:hypothetical protein n=1 Tax=Nostoc sp. TaxID=1180 RepID=UPI002FF8A513
MTLVALKRLPFSTRRYAKGEDSLSVALTAVAHGETTPDASSRRSRPTHCLPKIALLYR